jgi:hypothetical protein
VYRRFLDCEEVEVTKVGKRAHRVQQSLQPQPEQDVPGTYPHSVNCSDYPHGTDFLQLDYLYTPSKDVAADAKFFTEVLGGKLGFAIEGMGARVAMIELTDGPPHVLLTDHLEGDRPIYVYRVENLKRSVAALKKRGLKDQRQLEIPMGPCSSFVLPSGHRIALYEASRPFVLEHFLGRRDF